MRLHSTLQRGSVHRDGAGQGARVLTALPLLVWLPTLAALLLACSPEPQPGTEATTEAPGIPADATPISGIYDVRGSTVPVNGGDAREIAGTVILREVGSHYSATFKLDTTFPGAAEPLAADVIGSGEGTISGRTLTGSTKTQLVVATVPGVDPDFAFIPRIVGARIVSSSVTELAPDGGVVIELQNRPAEGEDYQPTVTRLSGIRVADADGRRPDVAAEK
jgi:hypothetical protein